MGFLVAQMVKSLPATQETQVRFLGQEDALEEEWQPTPVFWPRESGGQRSLVGCPIYGVAQSRTQLKQLSSSTHIYYSESESVSHSVMSDSAIAQTVASQAPLSMEFSRQEYWSGWPFLLQGIFQTQGLNPGLLHCRQILYCLSQQGSPCTVIKT